MTINFLNRRIRTRTYGGVGGARGKPRPLSLLAQAQQRGQPEAATAPPTLPNYAARVTYRVGLPQVRISRENLGRAA